MSHHRGLAPGLAPLQLDVLPVIGLRPLEDGLSDVVAWPRFSVQVVGSFALIALLLSCMGIYGVTAFGVNRRRKEIGIRVALGADASGLVQLILRNAARLALAGMATGVAVAWITSRFLESLLFEVAATDVATYLLVPLFLGTVALFAAWLPERRAVRVDPREALTEE